MLDLNRCQQRGLGYSIWGNYKAVCLEVSVKQGFVLLRQCDGNTNMNFSRLIVFLMTLSLLSACALQRQLEPENAHDHIPTEKSTMLLEQAEACLNQANSAERLYECRDQYRSVLELNQGDYLALARLSTIYTLIGTAYIERRSAKSDTFEMAMDYAEQAMLSNAEFRSLAQAGVPLWEAVEVLGESEVEAMFYWVTALQYAFQEGMSLPQRIINVRWLSNALSVLQHVENVAPDFGGGSVKFGKAICYLVLPESFGGSETQGKQMMRKAVNDNPGWLLPRWGRAKYYYEIMNEPEKKQRDLDWVASQDPSDFHDLHPWRVHFITDAREILRELQ